MPGLVNGDGTLNRAALGKRAFGDVPDRRKDPPPTLPFLPPPSFFLRKLSMDSLVGGGRGVGGWIRYKAIAYYYLSGYWVVVFDIPLLFESAQDVICGAALVASVSSLEV